MSPSPSHWEPVSLEGLGIPKSETVDPSASPDRMFELWSVPAFPTNEPELLTGKEIGSTKQRVFPGDVLLCKINPRINRVWVVRENGDGLQQIASSEWIVFRSQHWNAQFLRKRFEEKTFRDVLCLNVSGVGGSLTRARPKDVKDLEIALPPLNEQRRIADKIDALQAKSRRAREALETVGPLLEKFRQSVLAAAFRGDLTAEWRKQHPDVEPAKKLLKRIPAPQQGRGGKMPTATVIKGRAAISVNDPRTDRPEGWEWVSLLRVARQETGHTPSRKHPEYWDGDIPWLAIPDAGEHHGGFIYETHQHVTQEGLDNSSARLLPKNTVCLSRTASVGYIVIMGQPMATSQDFVTWTCSEALDPEYLMYALLAEGDHIKKFGKGSTHTTIYFPEVRALHICLAPIEEQREIVRIVKVTLGKYEKAATNVAAMHEGLTTLDQSILAKAFRGELVPQDPNDEPASVLLERIKAEREAGTGKKRTRKKTE